MKKIFLILALSTMTLEVSAVGPGRALLQREVVDLALKTLSVRSRTQEDTSQLMRTLDTRGSLLRSLKYGQSEPTAVEPLKEELPLWVFLQPTDSKRPSFTGDSAIITRPSSYRTIFELQAAPQNPFCFLGSRRNFSTETSKKEVPTFSPANPLEKKTVRILSIDGGGIRGIIPLSILSHLEERTEKPIAHLFDVITGTSTGGIISLALNIPNEEGFPRHSAKYIQNLYKNNNHQIFHQNFLLRTIPPLSAAMNFFQAKYSHKTLEKFLDKEFNFTPLSQAISTVIVPAFDIRFSRIHVFSNHGVNGEKNEDFYMRDVARATSAAPTYFSPKKTYPIKSLVKDNSQALTEYEYSLEKEYHLIDGGVSANNPALIAYFHSRKLYPEANDFFIVSLGTGTRKIGFTRYTHLKGAGFWGWARKLPGLMINAPSSAAEYCLSVLDSNNITLKCDPRYFRIQPELPEDLSALDSTHHEKIDDMIVFGETMVSTTHSNDINKIMKELLEDRKYAGEKGILKPGIHLTHSR